MRINRNLDEEIEVLSGNRNGVVPIQSPMTIKFNRVRSLLSDEVGLFSVRYVDESGRLRVIDEASISMRHQKRIVSVDGQSIALDLTITKSFVACSFFPECRRP